MKDSKFYIEKADNLIKRLTDFQQLDILSKKDKSFTDIFHDTELLFFGFSDKYPALLDLKLIKERDSIWYDSNNHTSDMLIKHLVRFKSFIQDYIPENL